MINNLFENSAKVLLLFNLFNWVTIEHGARSGSKVLQLPKLNESLFVII